MWAKVATAISRLQAWWESFQQSRRSDRSRPASYALVAAKRASAAGLWLAAVNGVALVVTFSWFGETYLTLKGDCVSRLFTFQALDVARILARWFVVAAAFALIAARLPTMVGMVRNVHQHRFKPPTTAPLQPGQELDGWSEHRVTPVAIVQWGLVIASGAIFGLLLYGLLLAVPLTVESLRMEWAELSCVRAGSAPLGGE
jgi:hypothetical protein